MLRFAQTKPHTLVVIVTGAEALGDKAWAQAAAGALEGKVATDVALVMFSNPAKTADDIERALSDTDHERLVFIAKNEGAAACAAYLSRFSAGVVEEFVACFTKVVEMPTDIMSALEKMPSVHVLDATGENKLHEIADGELVEVTDTDEAQMGAQAASFAAPDDEGAEVEKPGPEKREALPEEGVDEEDEPYLEDDVF